MPPMIYCTAALTSFSNSISHIFIFGMAYCRFLPVFASCMMVDVSSISSMMEIKMIYYCCAGTKF